MIFLPTLKQISIRVLLALVTTQDMELEQMDIKTIFIDGMLEENIFMRQPEVSLHQNGRFGDS